MPSTSMSLRRNDAAAVEITALAPGAGPPANKMATRFKVVVCFDGAARGLDIAADSRDESLVAIGPIVRHAASASQGERQSQRRPSTPSRQADAANTTMPAVVMRQRRSELLSGNVGANHISRSCRPAP